MVDIGLLLYVKALLGFFGHEVDAVLAPQILSAEQYLIGAGVRKPVLLANATFEQISTHERELAHYRTAVAMRVKVLFDGDAKGGKSALLVDTVAQMRAGG